MTLLSIHTLIATDEAGDVVAQVMVPSHGVLGDAVGAVLAASGWHGGDHTLVTSGLANYGTPRFWKELGLERRTQDERKTRLTDVFASPGDSARLEVDGHGTLRVALAAVGMPIAAPHQVGERSNTTTDRGPTS